MLMLSLSISMIQDRTDNNKTILIIEKDGIVETFSLTDEQLKILDKKNLSGKEYEKIKESSGILF